MIQFNFKKMFDYLDQFFLAHIIQNTGFGSRISCLIYIISRIILLFKVFRYGVLSVFRSYMAPYFGNFILAGDKWRYDMFVSSFSVGQAFFLKADPDNIHRP